MTTTHFQLNFRLVEYAEDEETKLREVTCESNGSTWPHRQPWTNMQLHGKPLLPHEIEGLSMIQAGLRKMLETNQQ